MKNLTKEEARLMVKQTLTSAESFIVMLIKHRKNAIYQINHGQLHLDFDEIEYTNWNNDLLALFPMKHPVVITSQKGRLSYHFLDDNKDCTCMGTREILEEIIMKYGDAQEIRRILEK